MKNIFYLTMSLFIIGHAAANEIALTFDDAPRGDELIYTGKQRSEKIIEILEKHKIQTVFFSNSKFMDKDSGQERLKAYSFAGHIIANHTHSHPDINKITIDQYIEEIDQADRFLNQFKTFTKWFRYPFLREGETVEARDKIRQYLKEQNYINGYVTVDNYDYFMNDLIQEALTSQKRVDLNQACQMLVDLMWDGIQFYDSVAKKHIGTVRHVLLMHENDLQAHCLDKLVGHIKNQNWKIVSPTRAFADPLLKAEPETLYLSQGRVAAIAHAKTGIKYQSNWESTSALRREFNKRKIVKD